LTLDPSVQLECGFLKIQGLPIQKSAFNCQTWQRIGEVTKRPFNVAEANAETPSGIWFHVYSQQHPTGNFTSPANQQVLVDAKKWAAGRNGANISDIVPYPFPHVTMIASSEKGRGNVPCMYGRFEGHKPKSDNAREYAYIQYCEVGTHTVSQETVEKVYRAISFIQPPPQIAVVPAPDATPPEVKLDQGSEVACGFLTFKGVAVRKSTVKCDESKRTSENGSTIEKAVLSFRLEPSDTYVQFSAEKDASGYGWKPVHSDQIRSNAQNFANKYSPKNMSDVVGSSFRHMKFNIFDNRDYACALGSTIGSKRARGAGEAMHYSWITFCERGTHSVSDETLGRIHSALVFN